MRLNKYFAINFSRSVQCTGPLVVTMISKKDPKLAPEFLSGPLNNLSGAQGSKSIFNP